MLSVPKNLETSAIQQTVEQKMCFANTQQHLSKTVAVKRVALELLSLCNSTASYASVVKGTKAAT